MTYVRVPKYAKDLRLGDTLDGCPEGCQCAAGAHRVNHLRVDHLRHDDREPESFIADRGMVIVESCNVAFPPREFKFREIVTVLVGVELITPMRAHAQRITASDLRARGWFRWYAKHEVACSCGWRLDEPVTGGAGYARGLWLGHKAEVVSALLAPKYSYLSSSAAFLVGLNPDAEWHSRYRVVLRDHGGAR
jgi:hypothetical protein